VLYFEHYGADDAEGVRNRVWEITIEDSRTYTYTAARSLLYLSEVKIS
jgi:hypothetical protein